MDETNIDSELEAAAWKALDQVIDPELGLPITDLGLVYDVRSEEGTIRVEMTTTSPICPLGDFLAGEAKKWLQDLPGVEAVEIALTNDPPWTVDRLNDRARRLLGHPG